MSVTHTPGPWRVAPAAAYSDTALNIDAGPSGTGAYICAVGHCGDAQAEADAKLIAAAPDLLGALRFILAFYEPGQRHLDTEAWQVAEASARAAVAKAEGAPALSSGGAA